MSSFRVVIPARFESTRLPGKILMDIAGKSMLQHVYERAENCGAMSVVVATDHEKVKKAAEAFGAEVVMTSSDHTCGTDRVAEVAIIKGYDDDEIVVGLQADEPLIPPVVVQQVADDLEQYDNAKVATLCATINKSKELFDPNITKVVLNKRSYAIYFSRAPIPWDRDRFPIDNDESLEDLYFRHIGLYAYRVNFLQEYAQWDPCPLELLESLEQLRVIWNGGRIHVAQAKQAVPAGIDTQEALDEIRKGYLSK